MKPKQPPDDPMTLGNMRELGYVRALTVGTKSGFEVEHSGSLVADGALWPSYALRGLVWQSVNLQTHHLRFSLRRCGGDPHMPSDRLSRGRGRDQSDWQSARSGKIVRAMSSLTRMSVSSQRVSGEDFPLLDRP